MGLVLRLGPPLDFVTVRWCEDSFVTVGCSKIDNIGGSLVGGWSCCARCIGWGDSGGGITGIRGSLISLVLLRSGRLLSRIVLRVSSDILRRKRRFQSVVHPLPSTKTRYCLCGRVSTIVPVLFQSCGWCPYWFWIATGSPTLTGFKCLSWTCLVTFLKRWLTAFSRGSAGSSHSRRNLTGFGKKSFRGRPNEFCWWYT